MGLDGALALRWVVPVTAELAGRSELLRTLAGETLIVPLGGTLDAPRLDLTFALGQLATGAFEGEARSFLEEAIGDGAGSVLGELLGGDGGAAAQESGRDPRSGPEPARAPRQQR